MKKYILALTVFFLFIFNSDKSFARNSKFQYPKRKIKISATGQTETGSFLGKEKNILRHNNFVAMETDYGQWICQWWLDSSSGNDITVTKAMCKLFSEDSSGKSFVLAVVGATLVCPDLEEPFISESGLLVGKSVVNYEQSYLNLYWQDASGILSRFSLRLICEISF